MVQIIYHLLNFVKYHVFKRRTNGWTKCGIGFGLDAFGALAGLDSNVEMLLDKIELSLDKINLLSTLITLKIVMQSLHGETIN
ncbi:MAG: hypothetical protein CM15mV75_280 [uncultured marine virus]|nr:MAG: hypothetical protein CM15mV75_280 [uncultured marine virus]